MVRVPAQGLKFGVEGVFSFCVCVCVLQGLGSGGWGAPEGWQHTWALMPQHTAPCLWMHLATCPAASWHPSRHYELIVRIRAQSQRQFEVICTCNKFPASTRAGFCCVEENSAWQDCVL